jgi:type IV pilus assembly protein PilB
MYSLKEEIANILLKAGHITKGQLARALGIQKAKGLPLRKILIKEGMITKDVLSALFSKRLYIPTLCLERFKFDAGLISLFPENLARLYNAIPLAKTADTFIISTSEPLNIFALSDLNNFSGFNIAIVLSPEVEIVRAIEIQYRGGQPRKEPDEPVLIGSIKVFQDGKVPVAQLVDIVLAHALNINASDIHIEPELDCLRIRYRVDGLLRDVLRVPKADRNSFFARLKIISGLDITESHTPQEGKFKVKSGACEVEFRVSSLPTTFGQRFVLHILDKSKPCSGLEQLGFSKEAVAVLKAAAEKPSGMILFSGPAGSGKSTTLYSLLNHLNIPEKNIVTIEDPVECQVDGFTQVQLKPDIGLDFACGLRSILRQGPDVVMVGQIRDSETADIAVKAALSGHLVLSTLQADDAISSIGRLIEMGVDPFLAASSLVMLCSQRLARKICFKCRKPIDMPKDFLEKVKFNGKAKFYTAQGCQYCSHTGFSGRLVISETVLIDEAIKDILINRGSMDEIRRHAVKHLGFKSLRDDSYLKVKDGLISLGEAIRITTEE